MKNIKNLSLIIFSVVLLTGILTYGAFTLTFDEGGYKLDPSSQGVFDGNAISCKMAVNNGSYSIFIPESGANEILAFTTKHPNYISVSTYAQPVADNTSAYSCSVGSPDAQNEADCHTNGVDRCYRWDCVTECGVDEGFYVDVGGGACFIAGTKIMLANGHSIAIESVSTGDILVGGDGSINTVEKLFKIFYTRNIYSINGSDYFVSDSHPFMTTEGWKSFNPLVSAKENPTLIITKLVLGDVLVTNHGLEKILSFHSKEDPQYVYNFEVNGNHTYFAHGYLVHNKNSI